MYVDDIYLILLWKELIMKAKNNAKMKTTKPKRQSNWVRIILRGLILAYLLPSLVILTSTDVGPYKYLVEPTFSEINPFTDNGLSLVKQNNYYGFINRKGEFVIPADRKSVV